MKKKIWIGICVACIIVFGIAVKNERKAIAEKKSEYTVEWDGIEYTGKYEGDLKNAVPEGMGKFVSKNSDFSYEGNWKKGKFSGEGTVVYGDGIKESGFFLKGKRNGELRKQLSVTEYEISNYKNNVPYGVVYKYKNDKLEVKDYYYGGKLISSILKDAKEISLSEVVDKEIEELLRFSATVLKVSQLETSCIILLENKDGISFMMEYSNCETKKGGQSYMPNVKEGDMIDLYGYYDGEDIYSVVNDSQYYGGIYPKIKPIWATVDETQKMPEKVGESGEYKDLLKNPYLYIGEKRQFDFIVDDVTYSNISEEIYCKVHSSRSEEEIYYIRMEEEELPLRGMKLSISGKINGQYKELQNVEDYLKDKDYQNEIKEPIREMNKKITNGKEETVQDMDISYEYKIYPLLTVEE